MVVNTKKENLCINQIVAKRNITTEIDGDIIIPDIKPDIINAINTSGNVFIYKKDIQDGKIKLDGSINIYVMYLPDGESKCVRGLNTSLDFTQVIDIDTVRTGMSSVENINIKMIECRVLNGRKVNLRVTLEISTTVYSNEDISFVQEIEDAKDIQILNKKIKINSLVGKGTNKTYAKDNIRIDDIDNLAEILGTNFSIINKEVKTSYNKLLVKADLVAKIMYLTEDNRISKVEGQIPIMGFVDIANIEDENICDVIYNIKNIVVKPNSLDEHSIYVEAQIELDCFAYKENEINLIQDLYSPNENIVFNEKDINIIMERKQIKNICNINEGIHIPEIENNRIYNVEIKPHINSNTILNDKIVFDGDVELNFLFEADNIVKIDSKRTNITFKYELPFTSENTNNTIETNIEIKNSDFVIKGEGEILVKLDLEIEAGLSNSKELKIINEINKEELNNYSDYSMVIYFVKKRR